MNRSYLSPATAKLTGKTLTARVRLTADLVDEAVAEVERPAHAALRERTVGARDADRAAHANGVGVDLEPAGPDPEAEPALQAAAEEAHHLVVAVQQLV